MLIFAASLSRAVNECGPLPYIGRHSPSRWRLCTAHQCALSDRPDASLALTFCVNDPGVPIYEYRRAFWFECRF